MTTCAIANRGEIARRILRTARARGYRVAVVSTAADSTSPVRREADVVLDVPGFLDGPAIVAAASDSGAHLLHPGYGFLSENAAFAAAVEAAGIGFVGPTPGNMRDMGDKSRSKALAVECGVPTLPSMAGDALAGIPRDGWAKALEGSGIGFPCLVKAAGGGGGRGMRVVADAESLPDAIRRASEEAAASFGEPSVFVEPYLARPRHVEVQVFGDGEGGCVTWAERECSIQRRHQKVLEESPSPAVAPALRRELGGAAAALVRRARYRGAGTVEFLLDQRGKFYFLEMNTRLQVEHPVTEMVYGIDLVDAQFELAEGRWPACLPVPGSDEMPRPSGWSMEARVLAESPRHGFAPAPGRISMYREPSGPGVRVDSGVCEGSVVGAGFDSLLAKLVVHAPTRREAVAALRDALGRFVIHGVTTNIPFLCAVAADSQFHEGAFHTGWLEERADGLCAWDPTGGLRSTLDDRRTAEALGFASAGPAPDTPGFPETVFARQPHVFPMGRARDATRVTFRAGAECGLVECEIADPRDSSGWKDPSAGSGGHGEGAVDQGARRETLHVSRRSPTELEISACGETWILEDRRAREGALHAPSSGAEILAPMAGKVLEVRVREGERIGAGHLAFVVESMKMHMEVRSTSAGTVEKVLVRAGDSLAGPVPLAVLSTALA